MHNQDYEDHILTWGIVAEALSAVAIGLSNETATSCQFDVYNGRITISVLLSSGR